MALHAGRGVAATVGETLSSALAEALGETGAVALLQRVEKGVELTEAASVDERVAQGVAVGAGLSVPPMPLAVTGAEAEALAELETLAVGVRERAGVCVVEAEAEAVPSNGEKVFWVEGEGEEEGDESALRVAAAGVGVEYKEALGVPLTVPGVLMVGSSEGSVVVTDVGLSEESMVGVSEGLTEALPEALELRVEQGLGENVAAAEEVARALALAGAGVALPPPPPPPPLLPEAPGLAEMLAVALSVSAA